MSTLVWKAARVAFDATSKALRVASRVPGSGRLADIVLDTILGPVEDTDYVSTTAPSSPPPARQ